MKKLIFILIVLVFAGCEDVIDLPLETSKPKLVVEASILLTEGESEQFQIIELSLTSNFYKDEKIPAEGAEIIVTDEYDHKFEFREIQPGLYATENFRATYGLQYELTIIYEAETYVANSRLIPAVDFEYIEQSNTGGFSGEDVELKAYFQDPLDEENYYLFRFSYGDLSLQILEDEFINGNYSFAFLSDENLKSGDQVDFEIQGITKEYYNYLFILRSQSGANSGGPFQTQPTTVRGNIKNITNLDNYPLGYFRLSQNNSINYTVE